MNRPRRPVLEALPEEPRSIAVADNKQKRIREFKQKLQEHRENTAKGVNIPQINKAEMKKIRERLIDLFKNDLNPLLKEFQPEPDNFDEWQAFEGAYEECLHLIRRHIMKALDRDEKRLYGTRKMNAKVLAALARRQDETYKVQEIQRSLRKLKEKLEKFTMINEDSPRGRAQMNKLRKELHDLFRMMTPSTRRELFGDETEEAVWETLIQAEDRRNTVIEWLEAQILTEAAKEIKGMAERLHAAKVQEAYSTSPGIAMKRFIDHRVSPPCRIEKELVTSHFREAWARPHEPFEEAPEGHPFHLESRISEENGSADMMEFMLSEKNIKEVIQSRQDLSSNGNDGVGYRIIKAAGQEGVKFMKLIIEATIRCKKVFKSWKEARTILIFKKGREDDINNWRPISITNCIYRIYTCLMARCFQAENQKAHFYTDRQKGFIKKTNGCSEHAILLNELFQDARRKGKDLYVTTIDFANAFGSVPHELIFSTMKQRGFPEWVIEIVKDMYDDAKSTILHRGEQTEPISWRKGVKQGCPLSPLLFNLCLEPLLEAIQKMEKIGAPVALPGEVTVEFKAQAYADDLLLISGRRSGIEVMLGTVGEYEDWAKMGVNDVKCETVTYTHDDNGRRAYDEEALKLKGRAIRSLTMGESAKYLGTPVAAHRTVKLKPTRIVLTEMKELILRITSSPLRIVQKLHAIKTFALPKIDYLLMNADVGVKYLDILDENIRGMINRTLAVHRLPVECHHCSWRDGGQSIPSTRNRADVLAIRSLVHMLTTPDQQLRAVSRQFIEDERVFKEININPDAQFFDWEHDGFTR
jgi:hypothetical protein